MQIDKAVLDGIRPARRSEDQPLIMLDGAGKVFDARGAAVRALQPVDLSIRKGEFVALVGPSGCGKSTALNMIAGLFQPTEGAVVYEGRPLTTLNDRVGYMTQKDTLLPWRTASDNVAVAFELKHRAIPKREAQDRVADMLHMVGLTGFEKHFPTELSGGMRRRVALARSLVYRPETLLMDEPFGALDAQLKLVMQDQLQRLTRSTGMTVVFVTHDLGEAIALADRIVVFSGRPGRIKVIRDIDIARPRDVYTIRFSEHFRSLHEELWDALKDEVIKGTDV
jgi:NitT/TauT family transport system ATP-binding protein